MCGWNKSDSDRKWTELNPKATMYVYTREKIYLIYLIYPKIKYLLVCKYRNLENSLSFCWVYGVATVESALVFWLALGQGYIHPISRPKLFWYTCNYKAIKQYHSLPIYTLNNQSSSIAFERWRLCFGTRLHVHVVSVKNKPTFKASTRFPIKNLRTFFKVTYYQRETHLQKLSKCQWNHQKTSKNHSITVWNKCYEFGIPTTKKNNSLYQSSKKIPPKTITIIFSFRGSPPRFLATAVVEVALDAAEAALAVAKCWAVWSSVDHPVGSDPGAFHRLARSARMDGNSDIFTASQVGSCWSLDW